MNTREKFVELAGAYAYSCLEMTGDFTKHDASKAYFYGMDTGVHVCQTPMVSIHSPRNRFVVDQVYLVLLYPDTGCPVTRKLVWIHIQGFMATEGQFFDSGTLLPDGEDRSKGRFAVAERGSLTWDELEEETLERYCQDFKKKLSYVNTLVPGHCIFRLFPKLRQLLYSRGDIQNLRKTKVISNTC